MTDEQPSGAQPRKKSETRQRQKQVKLRLLDEEFNAISAKASASGMSAAAYARAAMLGDEGPRAQRRLPIDAQLARQVLAQLGKYGNNMNQIAYGLNAYGERGLEADFREALREWAEIRDTLLAMLGHNPAPNGGRQPG
jgi:hypothetical protein